MTFLDFIKQQEKKTYNKTSFDNDLITLIEANSYFTKYCQIYKPDNKKTETLQLMSIKGATVLLKKRRWYEFYKKGFTKHKDVYGNRFWLAIKFNFPHYYLNSTKTLKL